MHEFRLRLLLRRSAGAFTLVELLVATGIFALTGGIVYTALNTGLVLYAKNFSINHSHDSARKALDRMVREMHGALTAPAPVLTDASGAPVVNPPTGSPRAGVQFKASLGGPYQTTALVAANATTLTVTNPQSGNEPWPTAGMSMICADPGVNVRVASVTAPTGSPARVTVTLAAGIGTVAISAAKPVFFLQDRSFILVGNSLRFYSQARTVAADGAAVFNDPANFVVLANNVDVRDATYLPFSFTTDTNPNPVPTDVVLRVRAAEYNNRVTDASSFLEMRSLLVPKSRSF